MSQVLIRWTQDAASAIGEDLTKFDDVTLDPSSDGSQFTIRSADGTLKAVFNPGDVRLLVVH